MNGEIVSADSRLFYRGMDIGTAKPTHEEMMRVPHHLIDIANPDEILSLAVFQQKATAIIADMPLMIAVFVWHLRGFGVLTALPVSGPGHIGSVKS